MTDTTTLIIHAAPPIWDDFKDQDPARELSHAFVAIDGARRGRINRPMMMEMSRESLREMFPILYEGRHAVKIDFRPVEGRGTAGIVTYEDGPGSDTFEEITNPEDAQPQGSTVTLEAMRLLMGLVTRVMDQNERLAAQVLEGGRETTHSQTTANERIHSHMLTSMERDRQRQDNWRERESTRDDRELRHRKSQFESDPMRDILPMLIQNAGNPASGPMAQAQDFMMSKLLDSVLDKIEGMTGDESKTGVEAILANLAPLLAQKFGVGGNGAVEPTPDA